MHCSLIDSVLSFVFGIQPPQLQRCGYEHTKTSAAGGTVTDEDAATVRLNNAPADRQAEPVAWCVRMRCARFAKEWREDAFAIVSRDARPIIVHRELQLAVLGDPGRDTNCCALWRVFGRVLHNVREHPLDLSRIHSN
jgi:hypothetical protein